MTAELRNHGPYGTEGQIHENGELVIGRRFDDRWLSVQWLDAERQALEADGWVTG
jgi:hypothetical protein